MRLLGSIMTFVKNIFRRDKKMTFKNTKDAFTIGFKDLEEESEVEEVDERQESNNRQNERARVQSATARKAQERRQTPQPSVNRKPSNNRRRMTEDERLELYIDRILSSQEKQNVNNRPKHKVKTLK